MRCTRNGCGCSRRWRWSGVEKCPQVRSSAALRTGLCAGLRLHCPVANVHTWRPLHCVGVARRVGNKEKLDRWSEAKGTQLQTLLGGCRTHCTEAFSRPSGERIRKERGEEMNRKLTHTQGQVRTDASEAKGRPLHRYHASMCIAPCVCLSGGHPMFCTWRFPTLAGEC